MKNPLKIFSAIVLITALFACKKKLFDYRNKYLGDYTFTYTSSYWQMGGVTGDTTINYTGQLKYGDKQQIKIEWFDGSEVEFELSKKGIISKCNSEIGKMDKHSLELTFTDDLCGTGPQGANYTVELRGNNQE